MKRVNIKGTLWPIPGERMEWKLRYKVKPFGSTSFSAAEVVAAYKALLNLPDKERNRVCRLIKEAIIEAEMVKEAK
jgi:hypothetical protein